LFVFIFYNNYAVSPQIQNQIKYNDNLSDLAKSPRVRVSLQVKP
jgi:hypothetical protein